MVIQHNPSDEELVRRAKDGSLDAFTSLYERYLPIVHRWVSYRTPELDVEDVTQEIFIAVMRSLKNFRGESLFSTWLRTLVQRHIADYYRQRKAGNGSISMDDDAVDVERSLKLSSGYNPGDVDDRIIIRQALRKLPERYCEIILLRFVDGLQFKDIADVQGQSLEATKSLFRRAVSALQKHLDETENG